MTASTPFVVLRRSQRRPLVVADCVRRVALAVTTVVAVVGGTGAACDRASPASTPVPAPVAPAPIVPSPVVVDHVPYHCPVVGAPPTDCPSPPAWLAPLVQAGDDALNDALCPRATAALQPALDVDAAALPPRTAVVAQNAALRLRVGCGGDARVIAQRAIEHLARPAAVLAALGVRPDVDALLGGAMEERAPVDWPLRHELDERGTRFFRMGRHDQRHALVSQFVAVDDTGGLHVTPFVAAVEMRDGAGTFAPACVARGDTCGVRPLAYAELPTVEEHRYGRVGDGVNCRACHEGGRTGNLDDTAPDARLERDRVAAVFGLLTAELARH